jgi:flagellar assembly protein FliH
MTLKFKSEKEKVEQVVVKYVPRKFPHTLSPAAEAFHRFQTGSQKNDFRIDKIVAQQTGISELERLSIEEQVEIEALQKIKEIQEGAYQQAYALGLDEGREKSYQENAAVIEERLASLGQVLQSISSLKMDLVTFNEAHILKLIYFMAGQVAMDEIKTRPEIILTVLTKAIENAQSEENVTVRVSPADLQFIQGMIEKNGKDLEVIKKVKLQESENITVGGCIVETNFGVVDATVEQRFSKLWAELSEKLPKVKDVVGPA